MNGLYEAALPIWKVNPTCGSWKGVNVIPDSMSWHQYMASLGFWGEERLRASSEDEKTRRFMWPGFVATCVENVDVTIAILQKNATFTDFLPALGGHISFWSICGALDMALAEKNDLMILKLYEASLSATVRMRLNPSSVQITLDRLSFVEEIRVQSFSANAESFFEFVTTCATLPGVEATTTPADIAKNLTALGVSFKGKKIENHSSMRLAQRFLLYWMKTQRRPFASSSE